MLSGLNLRDPDFSSRRRHGWNLCTRSGWASISCAEPVCRPRPSFCRLCYAVAAWSVGYEGVEQLLCCLGNLVHSSLEGDLVRLGGPSKATQLAYKLQRRCPDFVLCRWWFEVMEGFDRTTHNNPRQFHPSDEPSCGCRPSPYDSITERREHLLQRGLLVAIRR
jgi:hypothetical protein